MAASFMVLPWIFVPLSFRTALPTFPWMFVAPAESSSSFLAKAYTAWITQLQCNCPAVSTQGWGAGWGAVMEVALVVFQNGSAYQEALETKISQLFLLNSEKEVCMSLHNEWYSLFSQFLISQEGTQTSGLANQQPLFALFQSQTVHSFPLE